MPGMSFSVCGFEYTPNYLPETCLCLESSAYQTQLTSWGPATFPGIIGYEDGFSTSAVTEYVLRIQPRGDNSKSAKGTLLLQSHFLSMFQIWTPYESAADLGSLLQLSACSSLDSISARKSAPVPAMPDHDIYRHCPLRARVGVFPIDRGEIILPLM